MGPIDIEEFRSGGVLPSGSVSAWPKERHDALMAKLRIKMAGAEKDNTVHATKVTAGVGRMAAGLLTNAAKAVAGGKVSKEIREERYDTCKSCPFFIEESKRCSDCGCFMEAKTWINADPRGLCPKQKWTR